MNYLFLTVIILFSSSVFAEEHSHIWNIHDYTANQTETVDTSKPQFSLDSIVSQLEHDVRIVSVNVDYTERLITFETVEHNTDYPIVYFKGALLMPQEGDTDCHKTLELYETLTALPNDIPEFQAIYFKDSDVCVLRNLDLFATTSFAARNRLMVELHAYGFTVDVQSDGKLFVATE